MRDRLLLQRCDNAARARRRQARRSSCRPTATRSSRLAVSPTARGSPARSAIARCACGTTPASVLAHAARPHRSRHGRRVLARWHAARVGELRQDDPDLGARDRAAPRAARSHGPVNRVVWRMPHEVVSASQDGTLRVWQVPSTAPPTQRQSPRVSTPRRPPGSTTRARANRRRCDPRHPHGARRRTVRHRPTEKPG